MDERLEKALEFSRYRISLFNRKEDLKLRLKNMLLHATDGGIFTIDQQLITFVEMLVSKGRMQAVLLDDNGNPIEIADLAQFADDIIGKYFESTNLYYAEYAKLRSARTVKSIYEFVDD
jgi:hypothetical protein